MILFHLLHLAEDFLDPITAWILWDVSSCYPKHYFS